MFEQEADAEGEGDCACAAEVALDAQWLWSGARLNRLCRDGLAVIR